jgi:hypothetical protein
MGIDFYVFESKIPVDVTTDERIINSKIQRHGYPVILLPYRIDGERIERVIDNKKFNPYEYIDLISYLIKDQLKYSEEAINSGTNPVYFNNLRALSENLTEIINPTKE